MDTNGLLFLNPKENSIQLQTNKLVTRVRFFFLIKKVQFLKVT